MSKYVEISWTATSKLLENRIKWLNFINIFMPWLRPPRTLYKYQIYISKIGKPNKCVQLSSYPANFTLVIKITNTLWISLRLGRHIKYSLVDNRTWRDSYASVWFSGPRILEKGKFCQEGKIPKTNIANGQTITDWSSGNKKGSHLGPSVSFVLILKS